MLRWNFNPVAALHSMVLRRPRVVYRAYYAAAVTAVLDELPDKGRRIIEQHMASLAKQPYAKHTMFHSGAIWHRVSHLSHKQLSVLCEVYYDVHDSNEEIRFLNIHTMLRTKI